MQIRRVTVASVVCVCAWSCPALGKDVATIYSTQLEPDRGEFSRRDHLNGTSVMSLPSPVAWSCHLSGTEGLQKDVLTAWVGLVESYGVPAPELTMSSGGMKGHEQRSYFHMVTRGSAAVLGFELALMGVMMAMPRDAMKWEPDFVQDAVRNIGNHLVSPPVWDEDNWKLNYLGHPYAGSLYYNAVRAQGASPWQSFLFALGASTFWEYTVEATAEPASTQDLIVTPVAGALLGELFHRATLAMKKNGTSFVEGVIISLINPTHVVMKGYH
jgi:hypothetical protein